MLKTNEGYPPTHTFTTNPLRATGVLAERVTKMRDHFPEFFDSGSEFLDVGCSKGYFTIENSGRYKLSYGIDPDPHAIETAWAAAGCADALSVCDFENCGFRDFVCEFLWDRIMIANGPHHLYREIHGLEFVDKLAALSSDLVLTEGPIELTEEMKKEPNRLGGDFDRFIPAMQKHFRIVRSVPSVSYTPTRKMILWKRVWDRPIPPKAWGKKFCDDAYVKNDRVSVFLASCSPVSNGMSGFTKGGWLEPYSEEEPYKYFENERELFRLHAEHQVFLSRVGYVDIDPATSNFFKGSNHHFDKGGVMPIGLMRDRAGMYADVYEKLLRQSYRDVDVLWSMKEFIRPAFLAGECQAEKIETAFRACQSAMGRI